jgi:DeoR/GlpR family transcriptional regulator of sugar metabolism
MLTPPTSAARRSFIQRQLIVNGAVSVEALAKLTGVSLPTIRRDLTRLETKGLIRRTHGGAVVEAPRGADQEFALREEVDTAEKRAIAETAMGLIEPDATILMNDGSTILAVARELVASGLKATVVTPGVNIALLLSESSQITTYLLGGVLRNKTRGTTGGFAEQMLRSFNADLALIAAEGFTASDGLSYSYEADAQLARLMHERSARTFVLATARKLAERDRVVALQSQDVHGLITGCDDHHTLSKFQQSRINVIRASVGIS